MPRTFTDEELSRILSAHEGGQLEWCGGDWLDGEFLACVVQAATLEPDPNAAYRARLPIAREFDDAYDRAWTTDHLLAWLEAQGVA